MSFQTGFNGSTNSSAFPCSVTNGTTSEVAHDPRANRGGAGGVLKMTTHISRVLGKSAPMYNPLPEQWYGAATNCPIAPAYNDTPAPQYADGAYGPMLNRFSGTLSLPGIAAATPNTTSVFYLGLYGVPVYNTTDWKGCLPTIPVTFCEQAVNGYVLQVNNMKFTFKSSLDVTAGVTGTNNNQILQADGTTPWPYSSTAGTTKSWTLLDYYTVPAIVGPPAYNAANLPALAISITGDANAGTAFPAQTITWSLELLPPAQWGAGFAQLDGNGSGGAAVGYNRP